MPVCLLSFSVLCPFPVAFTLCKSFCPLCSAGSGSAEEEHDRVPGGDEYPYPGCSGTDRWLSARHRGRSRQLEEPRRQPLQWLLQLKRWGRTVRQGNPDPAMVTKSLLFFKKSGPHEPRHVSDLREKTFKRKQNSSKRQWEGVGRPCPPSPGEVISLQRLLTCWLTCFPPSSSGNE